MIPRHLILDSDFPANLVTVACQAGWVPYDKTQHTMLARLTGCPDCQVVQAARVVLLEAAADTHPDR